MWINWMSTLTLALITLLASTVLSLFSNSWLTIWVLLELNTLSFCSLLFKKTDSSNLQTKESLMKYLVVQSIASAMVILTGILKETTNNKNIPLLLLMVIALMIKMAAAPFHYWFISVTKKSSWSNNKILFTWQKLLPTYLVIFQPKKMIWPFVVFSCFVGAVFMVNKKSFKEVLALSSIFNLSWMLTAIVVSLKILLIFSSVYWVSLALFMKELTKDTTKYFDEKNSQSNKMMLLMKTINLAGIPPLMLFMVKWATFSQMLKLNMLILPSVILIMSSVNIFVYLRMATSMLTTNALKEQKNKKNALKYTGVPFLMMNIIILQMLT